jgi:hypothetical protein
MSYARLLTNRDYNGCIVMNLALRDAPTVLRAGVLVRMRSYVVAWQRLGPVAVCEYSSSWRAGDRLKRQPFAFEFDAFEGFSVTRQGDGATSRQDHGAR